MNKKILIHTLVFSPDAVSTAYLYNDIARSLKDAGFEVVVLTTTPQYNIVQNDIEEQPMKRKCLGLYYESNFEGIKVIHVLQKKFKKTIVRLFGFAFWHIMSFFLTLKERKIDLILSPSPPLTIGWLNLLLGKMKRAKVVYNVQEIYPDLLINESGLKSKTLISLLKSIEKSVYNRSDAVTTIDKVFYDTIAPRFKDPSKLHIIPNFVDTELYRPLKKEEVKLDEKMFPENDRIKLLYAGNIGIAQDWKPLVELAERVKKEPIDFYVVGEGVMKPYLESEIERRGLSNINLYPYLQRELMPSLQAYADLNFIFMLPGIDGHGFPSKVYTIMACERPLLVCSGENTPIVNFLKDKKCAILITDRDEKAKMDKLEEALLAHDKESLRQLGKNGLFHIENIYSKEIVTQKYLELCQSLLHL